MDKFSKLVLKISDEIIIWAQLLHERNNSTFFHNVSSGWTRGRGCFSSPTSAHRDVCTSSSFNRVWPTYSPRFFCLLFTRTYSPRNMYWNLDNSSRLTREFSTITRIERNWFGTYFNNTPGELILISYNIFNPPNGQSFISGAKFHLESILIFCF